VTDKTGQFAGKAERWSETAYASPDAYLAHRAELVASLGVPLVAGDEVVDLACGDGGLGIHLIARGLRYRGVDAEPAMVAAASRLLASTRLADNACGESPQALSKAAVVEQGELDTYEPPAPVAATTVFRAIYYARDRPAFFARARTFTEKKLVFDLNPRQYPVAQIVSELEAAGFARVVRRPFLVPQTRRLPNAAVRLAIAAESTPLARLALRRRFTYLVAALVDD
jgi:SAM-dependent methyltransferase